MKTEILHLAGLFSPENANNLVHALKGIAGVNEVSISSGGDDMATAATSATVQFDGNLTSRQELQTVLARAGYPTVTPEPSPTSTVRKATGGCCGGCGG